MNRYWMEDSFGKYGVELEPFGPYQLPLELLPVPHRRLPADPADCPHCPGGANDPCNQNFFNAARDAWAADVGAAERATYDNIFYVSAGQDESATWQEFGEMQFTDPETVTDAFGPKAYRPAARQSNWATTRYVPWTSWAAAANIWPQRLRHRLHRGRVLRHGRLRARALPQPGSAGQLQQPVRRAAAAHRRRHVGHDEPRLVQRPGRPAHPLA